MRHLLNYLWSNSKIGIIIAVVIAASAALISAWITPRGPVTTVQALSSMLAALLLGAVVGLVTANRWSMLVLLGVFMVVFEAARLRVEGPTVDGIHLRSTYGIIAFVLGRVVHGALVLAPMALGTVYGSMLAVRLGNELSRSMGVMGWIVTALVTIALGVVAVSIARPASTGAIISSDGDIDPNSIAELISVPIGGHEQTMMIRGRNVDNPVVLYLAGGPGGTDIGAMRSDAGLEEDFVVVTWDQRGAGKSYHALDPLATLTLDRMVADTLEVTQYLRDRFDEDKIYLVGQSWGSTLGVLAVQQHPEMYHAFIGVGQMVSQRETDIMFWEDTLEWAGETGNASLAETLRQNGPPPYENILKYEPVINHEHDWNRYPGFDTSHEMPSILFVPEYTWMDRINAFRGVLDSFSVLYPQLQDIDFRRDITHLDIPVYMVLGEHEARGRAVLAREWFETLEAPHKEKFVFERAGHRPNFDDPAAFAKLMSDILDATYTNQ